LPHRTQIHLRRWAKLSEKLSEIIILGDDNRTLACCFGGGEDLRVSGGGKVQLGDVTCLVSPLVPKPTSVMSPKSGWLC
jgi:hypothetical protein